MNLIQYASKRWTVVEVPTTEEKNSINTHT